MQNFINHRLSSRASRSFRRIAVGNTEETPMDNGVSAFNARWRYNKMKFVADYALMTPEAQQEIAAAFHAAKARTMLFRYPDYGDRTVTDSPLAPAVGTKTPIQLTKRYTFGSAYGERILQAVDSCTVKDSLGATVAGTLDDELGLFTPTNNWAAGGHTWSGRYCVWVRFATDELDMTMLNLDITTAQIELHEGRAFR